MSRYERGRRAADMASREAGVVWGGASAVRLFVSAVSAWILECHSVDEYRAVVDCSEL